MNLKEQITEEITKKLSNKFDDIIIEGLKLKGFEFDNENDLRNFIKQNCSCEDNLSIQQRVYFVNGIPFLLHNYEIIIEPITEKTTLTANYGTYRYL